jgi:hypothetical protein
VTTDKQRAQTAQRQQRFRERQALARRLEQQSKGLPALPAIPTLPGWARWNALLKSAQAQVEQVCDEMQTYYEARSELWQESERGETFAERQEQIDAVRTQLEEVLV